MIRRKRKPTPAIPQIATPQWPTRASVMGELMAALECLYPPPAGEPSDE